MAEDTALDTEKVFVVNNQTSCPSGYVTLKLEQVGESSLNVQDKTETAIPGFSAVTGVLGVGAAGLAALKRAKGGE